MEVLYRSTRSDAAPVKASEAILKGLADDGGLYVPTAIPALDKPLSDYSRMDYKETAYEVMKLFLTDYTEQELKDCIERAYDSKFDTEEIAPLHEADGAFYLELFHGATIAFKDMALSILPHLMITAARKNHEDREIVILTATSGDTGKAALAGFAGVEGTRIMVFYPKDGVSSIQERQMITQTGDNTCVIGIRGNFDDAQTGVKKIFTDEALRREMSERGYRFSSANSINIGRLVPQIVYYVYAYSRLVKAGRIQEGEKINFVVPTGNFGNILAAYYAMRMGLPVNRLICASNSNKVLYDFFTTGEYNRNREFILTCSPSMDILISSNLERLIYHIAGDDSEKNAEYMKQLTESGVYRITDEMKEKLGIFYGGFSGEEATEDAIQSLYMDEGYVIDPHTAVGRRVYDIYRQETQDDTVTVIASTASPFKFESTVLRALGKPVPWDYDGTGKTTAEQDLELAESLSRTAGVPVPEAIASLKNAEVRHTTVCEINEMEEQVRAFLKGRE